MRVAITMLAGLVLMPAVAVGQASIQRGTIAVIPFGAAAPELAEMAASLGVAVENALHESGRFSAVLPRAGDAAIRTEIVKTTEPTSLNSLVRIAQDAQLNANYVLAGWVLGQDVRATRDPTGTVTGHTARARVAVRILDVSTGAMLLSEVVTVASGDAPSVCSAGVRGMPCQALNAAKRDKPYPTPEEALRSILTNGNAQLEIQNALTEKLGYIVVDLTEGENGMELVLRAFDGDPRRGTKLKVVHMRASSLDESRTYASTLGKLEVTRLDGETAFALVREGGEQIVDALKKRLPILVLKE